MQLIADVPTADGRPVAALSASRELEPGARAAILHAPGLFRLDVTVRGDTLRTNVRNLSAGELTFAEVGATQDLATASSGDVAAYTPGATQLAFILGDGADAVRARVLIGTLAVPERGTVRVTAQTILSHARSG